MPTPRDQASPLEDYALIGDCETAALVSRNGSIDWLCWPRFDSGACFAALLGSPGQGRWVIAPADPQPRITRQYRERSMVLETVFETESGIVALIDFMPPGHANSSVIRLVEGRRGKVAVRLHMVLRFDYGASVPWITRLEDGSGILAIAGPDMVVLRTPVELRGEEMAHTAAFEISQGQTISFVMTHGASYLPVPGRLDANAELLHAEAFWSRWSARCTYRGAWQEPVHRSLITLKALTYAKTGGIVAAPTSSLPEQLGGTRNWDYRFCWLRDATLTLVALMEAGY